MSTWSWDPPYNLWCHTEQKRVPGDILQSWYFEQFMGFYRTYSKEIVQDLFIGQLTLCISAHALRWFLLADICMPLSYLCYLAVILHFEDHSAMAGFFTDLVHPESIAFYEWYAGPRVLSWCTHGTYWSPVGKNCTFIVSLFHCVICRWNKCNLGRFFLPLDQRPSYLHTQSEELPVTMRAREEEMTESCL